MDSLSLLNTVVPVLAISFVLVITCVNLFIKIRKKFPITVNCWFCNNNSKVPYDNFNSWTCSGCDQYNGFKKDGDYNQEIPAQYFSKLNPRSSNVTDDDKMNYVTPKNGLCFGCNRNQELKVHQLASFVPENEENYDEEVEEYEMKLEQAYKLCSKCDRTVKRRLNSVKKTILGSKLAQIGVKGLSIFDLHMQTSSKILASKKKKTFTKICIAIMITLLAGNFVQTIAKVELSKKKLELIFNPVISNVFLVVVSYLTAFKIIFVAQFKMLLKLSNVQDYLSAFLTKNENFFNDFAQIDTKLLLNFAVILLNILLLTLIDGFKKIKPLFLILLCSLDMLISSQSILEAGLLEISNIVLALTALILSYGCTEYLQPKLNPKQDINSSFHKIYSNYNSEIDEESDEEFDTTSSSLKSRKVVKNNENSLDTTKSLSPSAFTTSFLKNLSDFSPPKSCFGSTLTVNHLKSHDNLNTSFSSLRKTPSISMGNLDIFKYPAESLNKSAFFADETEFKTDIDRLSISGRDSINHYRRDLSKNPFSTHHEERKIGPSTDSQYSWVGGGYWSAAQPKISPPIIDFCPIISRTSSQSSGFESQRQTPEENEVFQCNTSSVSAFQPFPAPSPSLIPRSPFQRSLFSERDIFRNTPQPTSGIFAPQKSYTPLYNWNRNHQRLPHQLNHNQQKPPVLKRSLLDLSKLQTCHENS